MPLKHKVFTESIELIFISVLYEYQIYFERTIL